MEYLRNLKRNRKMTYRINGELVTKEEWDASPKVGITAGKPSMVHVVQPFVSPIDSKVISSGAGLKAHEREHGVIQVGNEYVQLIKDKKEDARERKFDADRARQYRECWRSTGS